MAKAVVFFTANLGWELSEVAATGERHYGAVLRTASSPDRRSFGHFVDF